MNEIWETYSQADRAKRAAEDELKRAEAVMKELEPKLLDMMAEIGMDKITLHGITYSPHRRLYVGPGKGADKEAVAQALVDSGLEVYVKKGYNANSLSAYVRNVADEHGGRDTMSCEELRNKLPEPLAKVLHVGEVWRLGSVKS